MKFIFACSGTAGHINPALAIAEELRKRIPQSQALFVGAGREMEQRLIPSRGYELVNIKMSGLSRGFSPKKIIRNIRTAMNLVAANKKAKRIIKEFSPDAVIGTGGYICYPVLKKAAKLGIPTVIHDSNAIPGLTSRLVSSAVDRVLVGFRGQESKYKKPERVIFTGTPLREGFAAFTESRDRRIEIDNDKPLVVSFWGSLGAGRMNDTIAELVKLNIKANAFNHIHAAGNNDEHAKIMKKLNDSGIPDELPQGIDIRVYIEDMSAVMAQADLILCRGGGTTVAELISLEKPAIIIPSPYVANNEQEHNAKQVEKAGGARIIHEKGITAQILYDEIISLLTSKDELSDMSKNLKTIAVPDAAAQIADIILSLCRQD